MNKYELICQYCNNTWQVNYIGKDPVRCGICKDSNIRVIDLARDRADYYIGCPAFEDEPDLDKWHS